MADTNAEKPVVSDPGAPTSAPTLGAVGEGTPTGDYYDMSPEELAARNKRNLFTALAVVAFIVLIFSTTMLRLLQNAGASAP